VPFQQPRFLAAFGPVNPHLLAFLGVEPFLDQGGILQLAGHDDLTRHVERPS
jgi:hypothetical protein